MQYEDLLVLSVFYGYSCIMRTHVNYVHIYRVSIVCQFPLTPRHAEHYLSFHLQGLY